MLLKPSQHAFDYLMRAIECAGTDSEATPFAASFSDSDHSAVAVGVRIMITSGRIG